MKENKIYQPEQVTVKRSEVNFASYNPRIISDDARKRLKENIKKIGLLGGVVWNKRTGNLVSGHQRVSVMDSVNRYDPETGDNDYEFRVEAVDLDETTEKEQNLFMNNKSVQGKFDDDLLRTMLSEIDYSNAGFDEFDLQLLGLDVMSDEDLGISEITTTSPSEIGHGAWTSEKAIGENAELASHYENTKGGEEQKVDRSVDFYNDTEANQLARHNEVQKIKDRILNQNDINKDGGMLSYVVISFANPTEKMRFMEDYGFDPFAKYIKGDEFVRKIEFGEEDEE